MTLDLETIQIINVRNHADLLIDFAQTTVLTGVNGSGKTAVLEAISLLSVATSWKTERESELIRFEESFARVVAGDREIVVQKFPATKRYKIDGVPKRLSEVLGLLPTVLFQPDDSELVHGSPAVRRAFLDRLLSQVEKGYVKTLSHYQKVLKQRNALLKLLQDGAGDRSQLEYWDSELATAGEIIRTARKNVVDSLQVVVKKLAPEILESTEVDVAYAASPAIDKDLLAYFQDHHVRDIAVGSSMGGPHRDDLHIHFNQRNADEVASRGQTRVIIFGLKMAELAIIEECLDHQPILLLDDVFAEFDRIRREKIALLFGKYQTVMTATEMPVELVGVKEVAIK